jgi:hypothetical protein
VYRNGRVTRDGCAVADAADGHSSAGSSDRLAPPFQRTLRSADVSAEPAPDFSSFSIRRSHRARRARVTITENDGIVVVLPLRAPDTEAQRLLELHSAWIDRHVGELTARRRALAGRPSLAFGRALNVDGQPQIVRAATAEQRAALERRLRRLARVRIDERVRERSAEMGIDYRRVTIRDQRSRWGSASGSGTLSFSWRLILVPSEVLDYVVVHELAHLRAAGHGPRFWTLVNRYVSDSRAARQWLRENHDAVRHALD